MTSDERTLEKTDRSSEGALKLQQSLLNW